MFASPDDHVEPLSHADNLAHEPATEPSHDDVALPENHGGSAAPHDHHESVGTTNAGHGRQSQPSPDRESPHTTKPDHDHRNDEHHGHHDHFGGRHNI